MSILCHTNIHRATSTAATSIALAMGRRRLTRQTKYDVAVVGGGPGGYAAAIRAAQLGLKTVCIEKRGNLGGTCLNVGCIPSKALLNVTHKYEEARKDFGKIGIVCEASVDLAKMHRHKDSVVKSLTQGIEMLFKKNGVAYVKGEARLKSPTELSVNGVDPNNATTADTIQADHIVIATGSVPTPMPGGLLPVDEKVVVSSTGALQLGSVPKRMIIVGAGVIGMELGSVWSRLGTEVEVIEFLDCITSSLDGEARKVLQQLLQKRGGFKFQLSSKVTGADIQKNKVHVHYENKAGKHSSESDVVLVAVGRRPYTSNLGLENISVTCDELGRIPVDSNLRVVGHPNVFAIGDVIGGAMLAHKAEDEAIAVATYIANSSESPHINYDAIPSVVYTHPEVAGVGRTEEQLRESKVVYKKGTFPLVANGRARTANDSDGFCKVLYDSNSRQLLGAWLIAPNAGELIAELTLAMEQKITVDAIARTSHAHPTISEIIREACMQGVNGRALHMA